MTQVKRPNSRVNLDKAIDRGKVDYAMTKSICVRLFEYRQKQPWPPVIVKGDGWDTLYANQAKGLSVLPTADEAVAWANDLIAAIDNS